MVFFPSPSSDGVSGSLPLISEALSAELLSDELLFDELLSVELLSDELLSVGLLSDPLSELSVTAVLLSALSENASKGSEKATSAPVINEIILQQSFFLKLYFAAFPEFSALYIYSYLYDEVLDYFTYLYIITDFTFNVKFNFKI